MAKRKTKRVNPLLALPYAKVYDAILSGNVTSEDFEEWIDEVRCSGYESGYNVGYESAQESYGDGPST